jgi:hypothetical protein
VHSQDVLGGQAAGLAVLAPVDAQLVVDALQLQWLQGIEEPGAEVGAYVMGQ